MPTLYNPPEIAWMILSWKYYTIKMPINPKDMNFKKIPIEKR